VNIHMAEGQVIKNYLREKKLNLTQSDLFEWFS